MAASALVSNGTGTTLVATTSTWTSNLLEIQWSGIKRKALETSNMGTTPLTGYNGSTTIPTQLGSMTFIPGALSDGGSLKAKVHFNPDKVPPIDSPAETWTVTFPKGANTTGAKWAASAFVTDFEITDTLETIIEASMTLKVSGNVSFTAAA